MPTFQTLFPNFQSQCTTLYTTLLPVATVLVIAGLIATMKQAYTVRSMLRAIIGSMMIVMAIAEWGNWTDIATESFQSVASQMNANPQQAAQQYVNTLVSQEQPQQKNGWFGLPTSAQMYEAVLWGFLSLIGLTAEFLIWAAYIIQQFLLGLAYGFAPVFLGFLALQSTRGTGFHFIMNTVGIIAWPLGWAAASIGTSNLIDVATNQGLVMTDVYSLQTILAAAVIGGWIILTTLIAPVVIQAAVSSGANVGSGLLGGAVTSGAAAVSAAASTGATLATGGAAAPMILAGSGLAATTSLAGAAMHGGGGPLSGSEVQSVAFNMTRGGSSSRSQNSNDPQGGGGTQGPPSQPFNPKDAGNDGPVEQMIKNSAQEGGIS